MYNLAFIAVLIVTLMTTLSLSVDTEKKIFCYFVNYALYRQGNGKMDFDDIDPTLCTHLVYGFAEPQPDGGVSANDSWADFDYGLDGYRKFNNLRKLNPSVKTLISIIGLGTGTMKAFARIAASESLRSSFADNLAEYAKTNGFDGAEIGWWYPNYSSTMPEEKALFLLLLKAVKKRFEESNLILSAVIGASKRRVEYSYILPNISEYLDFLHLMTNDFHGTWDRKTGIHSPLKPGSWEIGDEREKNIEAIVDQWISSGVPLEKLLLSITTYGRTFTLDDPNLKDIGAPANKPGREGPYTAELGSLGYNEICEMKLKNKDDWEEHFQEEQRVPYAIIGDQWIGYENIQSVKEKAELILNKGLGGASVYGIATDDFKGICGGKKYPLLTVIKETLHKDELAAASTELPITTLETS